MKCYKCNEEKSQDSFSINKNKRNGVNLECKDCAKKYAREYYRKNRDKCISASYKAKKGGTCSECGNQTSNPRVAKCKQCIMKSSKKKNKSKTNRKKIPKICLTCKKETPRRTVRCYKCYLLECRIDRPDNYCKCGAKIHHCSKRCKICCQKKEWKSKNPLLAKTPKEYLILVASYSGLSYMKITKIFGVSKSLVAYYCNDNVKTKAINQSKLWKKQNTLKIKISRFVGRKKRKAKIKPETLENKMGWQRTLYSRVHGFHFSRYGGIKQGDSMNFTAQDIIDKFGMKPICYISGRQLDLEDPTTYELDHIVPVSKGGDNSFENLGIAHPDANHAKSGMIEEDFLQLCKEIVEFNKLQ